MKVHLYKSHKSLEYTVTACGRKFSYSHPDFDCTTIPGFVTCKACEKTIAMKRNLILMGIKKRIYTRTGE